MNHDLNKISLPITSRNHELETISKRVFEPLFDVERFILKGELIDNGVDYRCEIKNATSALGFGFIFQLKSKEEAVVNLDGSYSKSLETSNIEYLLNNAQPAFYGFYIAEINTFYYESLDDFISSIHEKNPDWQNQPNHTLRFTKTIDEAAVNLIYDLTLKRGIMHRKLNSALAIKASKLETGSKIVIDYDSNVTADEDIIAIIEKFGLQIINQSDWSKVIDLHLKTSHSIKSSPKYNMAVGLAYYYLGKYISALNFFEQAFKNKVDLDTQLQNHLIYVESSVRFMLRMIDNTEYYDIINNIPQDNHIKFHITIDSAVEKLKENLFLENSESIENEFTSTLNSIINNPNASNHVKLRAKSEKLIYEGKVILHKYLISVCRINAFEESFVVNRAMRKDFATILEADFQKISTDYTVLYKEAQEINDYFAFFYLFTYRVKYEFEWHVNLEIVKVVKEPSVKTDYTQTYIDLITNIDQSIDYFTKIGHLDNQLFSKTIKYEILHYTKSIEAEYILNEIEDMVTLLNVKDIKQRLDFLKNGGTNHEMLQNLINEKVNNPQLEIENLRAELIKLDEIENDIVPELKGCLQIQLFPIGTFLIPESKLETFHSIFQITNTALKAQFDFFFENGIVPTINTYVFPVITEGPLNGNLEYIGIESFRNMYNARKAFFEHKFYRMKIKE